jgi:hypothetical protein
LGQTEEHNELWRRLGRSQGNQPKSGGSRRNLIKTLERLEGRKLTEQEINLSLDQARAIGEL